MNIDKNELLEKAKEQINLIEYAKSVLTSHEFNRIGKSTFIKECPVCKGHDHFSIYTDKNYYNSFADCCKGGSIVDFMMEVEHLTHKDAIRKTLELAGYGESIKAVSGQIFKEEHRNKEQGLKGKDPQLTPLNTLVREPNIHEPVTVVPHPNSPDFTSLILKTHSLVSETDYFFNRGLTVKTIEQYKLGYNPEGFNFAIRESEVMKEKENELMMAYKYFLPVLDADGACSYFISRLDEGAVPSWANNYGKTHNPKGMKVRLFNDRYLTGGEVQGEFIFITEGIFDALSLEEFDYPAIALNSVENAKLLLETLNHAPEFIKSKTFILIPDNDNAGERLVGKLTEGFNKLGFMLKEFKIPSEFKDFNEFLVAKREEANKFIRKNINIMQNNDFVSDYMDEFLQEIALEQDIKVLGTGFNGLDEKLGGGLFPGLYILGAIPSLGKTTLVLQIADHIALAGDDVLYFSLEMSRKDLISRSLSRGIFTLNPKHRYSARKIRLGKCPIEVLNKGVENYKGIKGNVAIIEGNFGLGVKEIRERIKQNIRLRGKKPLVVVDYFQILKPFSPHMSDKQANDYNISELKRISRDYDIPIIAICSLNRYNYNSTIGFESLKETGSLEYSADVVLGMQLRGIENVAKAKTETDKRNLVNQLKNQDPREIEVAIIKQRDGMAFAKQDLRYFPKVNWFDEVD